MIKTTTKTKQVQVSSTPVYEMSKLTTYTCSDGKAFTNERDGNRGYKTGLQLANEHEKYLERIDVAKREILFHSIDKYKYHDYETEFLFYYKKDISKDTENILTGLVFEIDYNKLRSMVEGWYYVKQNVYEVDSSGMNCKYECDGTFELFSKFIEDKETVLTDLKKIQVLINKIKK